MLHTSTNLSSFALPRGSYGTLLVSALCSPVTFSISYDLLALNFAVCWLSAGNISAKLYECKNSIKSYDVYCALAMSGLVTTSTSDLLRLKPHRYFCIWWKICLPTVNLIHIFFFKLEACMQQTMLCDCKILTIALLALKVYRFMAFFMQHFC